MTSAVCSDGVNHRLRRKSRVVRPRTPMASRRASFCRARSTGGWFQTASRTSVSNPTTRFAPIEAALIAGRRAPGLRRTFAFETFAGHDAGRTARLRDRFAALARPIAPAIHASDRNAGALRLAQKNAAEAGVAEAIRFERLDAAAAAVPDGPGLCVVNPPYGIRLDEATAGSWAALAALLPRLAGWEVAVFAPERGYEKLLPPPTSADLQLRNGGIRCRLLRYHPGPESP